MQPLILMAKPNQILLSITVLLLSVCCCIVFSGTWQAWLENLFSKTLLGQALWFLVPASILLMLFHGPKRLWAELGLNRPLLPAAGFAMLFVAPMLVGAAVVGHINTGESFGYLLLKTFKEGFTEEVFFRAFLFGQLFRRCHWGFVPAAAVPAILFGIGHLYQGHSWVGSLAAFGVTFAAAVWFSWLWTEWRFNTWLPLFLHFLMNLSWEVFSISNGAVGGWLSNVFRAATIFLSIYLTIKRVKKRGDSLLINRRNLFRPLAIQTG
jgi:uncharacterized protein